MPNKKSKRNNKNTNSTEYDKDIIPPTPRNIYLANSDKFYSAFIKMKEISDYYFDGGQVLFKDLTEECDNLVMFNIMGKNGKPVQSFLWDESKSTVETPAFHDWTKILEEREKK